MVVGEAARERSERVDSGGYLDGSWEQEAPIRVQREADEMGASERAGQQPARSAAHLQREDCPNDEHTSMSLIPIEQDVLDALTPNGAHGGKEEKQEAAEIAERLARLAADRNRITEFRAMNFAGPKFEIFKADLAAYGYPIIRSWIRRGLIYKLTKDRGRGVTCSDSVREHLTRDVIDRRELALETVAQALRLFVRHALIEGTWSPEGGASLTTYFVGACLAVFPNVFRRWHTEHQHWQRTEFCGLGQPSENASRNRLDQRFDHDPADTVVSTQIFLRELKAMPDRVRFAVAAVVLHGASYAEIAKELNTTEEAVKQLLHRYRTEARRRQAERERT